MSNTDAGTVRPFVEITSGTPLVSCPIYVRHERDAANLLAISAFWKDSRPAGHETDDGAQRSKAPATGTGRIHGIPGVCRGFLLLIAAPASPVLHSDIGFQFSYQSSLASSSARASA